MFGMHLVINTKEGFFSSLQIYFNPCFSKLHPNSLQNLINHLAAITACFLDRFFDHPKAHGHRMLKADVL